MRKDDCMMILAINTGSTSTKIAVYKENVLVFVENIVHSAEALSSFGRVTEQLEFRQSLVASLLKEKGVDMKALSLIVGRGGLLPPVQSGAYKVNQTMINRLKSDTIPEHASNLSAIIAYKIAEPLGIDALIYDSVAVDELTDVARLSGSPLVPRKSFSHTLNSRAMAHEYAKNINCKYSDLNLVIAHLGGGISVNAHFKGKMVDIIADDEGPFSPERAGRVPCNDLIELCFSGQYSKNEIKKSMRGKGGIMAYLGTTDAKSVGERAENGDQEAALVFEAMAYQISKGIGEMATVLKGDVDAIILTGGIAYSNYLTEMIRARVEFIGKVVVMPGENEMEALASGAYRVFKGEESAHEYIENLNA
ncbi:butyrate kinase [Fusibacter sp. 3D3]|uniref:butyrate kinase n=1 Tax=Fusibacter sp. 3D3 TaxID=1048380 RepID=UPI000857281E|nr:butyrate kinase [Fusibacter sp. 3D3]GAU79521.1 butyrate kinase [Fusibacter sp. 3D3]